MNIIEEILTMYEITKFTKEGKQLFLDESKKILDNYIDERFKLNFISSSTQLKDKEVMSFEKWLKVNNYTKKNELLYSKGISLIHKNILYKFYESEINL